MKKIVSKLSCFLMLFGICVSYMCFSTNAACPGGEHYKPKSAIVSTLAIKNIQMDTGAYFYCAGELRWFLERPKLSINGSPVFSNGYTHEGSVQIATQRAKASHNSGTNTFYSEEKVFTWKFNETTDKWV